jgi:His/Glu/Gln/Arg/opine family amino acid ABC transporter permease subunit
VGDFQWARILGYLPDLVRGVGVTLQLGLISASLGLVLGLVLALMKFSKVPVLYWPAYVYIEFFRTTPPLVQIVWLYYGLPLFTGYDLGAFGAAAVALGLNIAAFYAEIYRAGIVGVHRTQWQAARVLGLNLRDTLRYVVLPQAVRNVLPPMGTDDDLPDQGHGARFRDRHARAAANRPAYCRRNIPPGRDAHHRCAPVLRRHLSRRAADWKAEARFKIARVGAA